jgi:hypothetical protein
MLIPSHFVLLYCPNPIVVWFGELAPEAVFRRARTIRTTEFHPRMRRLCHDKRASIPAVIHLRRIPWESEMNQFLTMIDASLTMWLALRERLLGGAVVGMRL